MKLQDEEHVTTMSVYINIWQYQLYKVSKTKYIISHFKLGMIILFVPHMGVALIFGQLYFG